MKLASLEAIFKSLNSNDVRYIVAGGTAVNIHGYQRMTADLDIIIKLDSRNIEKAINSLKNLGFSPTVPININDFMEPEKRQEWIEQKNMQVLSLQSSQLPDTTIDIFVSEPFIFSEAYSQATKAEIAPDLIINVANIPTLIDMKKKSGRPRDLDDIEHLQIILEEKKDG